MTDKLYLPLWSKDALAGKPASVVIDLATDESLRALFTEHPYIPDVLQWLGRRRAFSQIRHGLSECDFDVRVLPRLLSALYHRELVTLRGGVPAPVYEKVEFLNLPALAGDEKSHARWALEGLIHRAERTRAKLFAGVQRTRASREKIEEWQKRLEEIGKDIEDHADVCGIPFSLNIQGACGA